MRKKGRKKYTRKRDKDIPVSEMLPMITGFFKIATLLVKVMKENAVQDDKPALDNIQDTEAEVISTEIKK